MMYNDKMTKKVFAVALLTFCLAACSSNDEGATPTSLEESSTTTEASTSTSEESTTTETETTTTTVVEIVPTTPAPTTQPSTTEAPSTTPAPTEPPPTTEAPTTTAGGEPEDDFTFVPVPESPNDLQNGAYETSFGWLVFDDFVKGFETAEGGVYGNVYADPEVCDNAEAVLLELNAPGVRGQYFFTCFPDLYYNPTTSQWEVR